MGKTSHHRIRVDQAIGTDGRIVVEFYTWIQDAPISTLRIILHYSIIEDHAAGTDVSVWANVSRWMDYVWETVAYGCGLLIEPLT